MRAPKYCTWHDKTTGIGCMELVPGGTRYCATHDIRWHIDRHQPMPSDWRAIRARILKRDGHVCGYCGGDATTVDHIVARAHGGDDEDRNLIACCAECNEAKRKHEAMESRLTS